MTAWVPIAAVAGFTAGALLAWVAAVRAVREAADPCGGLVWNGTCTRSFRHRGACRA